MGSFFEKSPPTPQIYPFAPLLPRSTLLRSAPTLRDAFNYAESVAAEAERIALAGGFVE